MKNLSLDIGEYLKNKKLLVATAESCTAGLISSTIAETPGSSLWLDSGFVVYSAEAKNQSLGVSFDTINKYNITSCEVAEEMAIGAILKSRANVSLSTTGVAGPAGGTIQIPVGTVCLAWGFKNNENITVFSEKALFNGNRNEIRQQATEYSLNKIEYYFNQFSSLLSFQIVNN
jgi:PncC family amidohydrolase